MMQLNELQTSVDEWIQQIGGYWNKFQILARLTEELGELAAALQREEGLRPRKVKVNLADELGDMLFTLAAFANATGLDLEHCVVDAIAKYKARDAAAWKRKEGRTRERL